MERNKTELFLEIGIQEKHKISPVGEVSGLDGRSYFIDGVAVVEYMRSQKLDIYLDENHRGGKAKGWYHLDTLEAKEDGIYACVEYTKEGKELVESKAYRYLSPTYIMGEGRNVLGIDSVALVNTPNLLNTAINKKGQSGIDLPTTTARALMERVQDARAEYINKEHNSMTHEEINELIEQLKAELFTQLREELLEELSAELKAAVEEVATVKDEVLEGNKQRRIERIEQAVASGRLSANKRDFALTLDSAQFEQFLAVSAAESDYLKKPADIEKNSKHNEDEITKLINQQLGI